MGVYNLINTYLWYYHLDFPVCHFGRVRKFHTLTRVSYSAFQGSCLTSGNIWNKDMSLVLIMNKYKSAERLNNTRSIMQSVSVSMEACSSLVVVSIRVCTWFVRLDFISNDQRCDLGETINPVWELLTEFCWNRCSQMCCSSEYTFTTNISPVADCSQWYFRCGLYLTDCMCLAVWNIARGPFTNMD